MEEAVSSTLISSTIFYATFEAMNTKRQVCAKLFLPAIVLILLLPSVVSFGKPSIETTPSPGMPDLFIIVDARMPGQNKVSLTYAKLVPRPEVDAAFGRLLTETGWQALNITYSNASLEESGQSPMTSVEFSTPQAIRPETGELPIEPIIKAYRNIKNIQVLFMIPQGFAFQGVQSCENKYVRIVMKPNPGTYMYAITVKDPGFKELNLPTLKSKESTPDTENYNTLKIAFVVVLALLAAMLGYLITNKLSHRGRGNRN